jgi:hypothetical protein
MPVERPQNWIAWVNRDWNEEQLETLQTCVQRDRLLGPEAWVRKTTVHLGLEYTLRGLGRPRNSSDNQ